MTYDECLEELLDRDVPERSAERAATWAERAIAEARAEATSETAQQVLGCLFDGPREHIRRRAVGMAFAMGRSDLAGYLTLDQAAIGEGCSHTAIANWRREMLAALADWTGGTPGKKSIES